MDLYFDESWGRQQDRLILGGVAFHTEDLRRAAEKAWNRPVRKARKWAVGDFVSLARFIRDHCSLVTGCHVRITQDLRDALSARAHRAREMQLHVAHGATTHMKPNSWLWMQMVGHFAGLFMAALIEAGLIVHELRVHPDRSTLPDWQRRILRDSLASLDGQSFQRLVGYLPKGQPDEKFLDACRRSARWRALQFGPNTRSSRLTDIADGYCALYGRVVDGDDSIAAVVRDELGVSQRITTDVTELLLWRARLGWQESASTLLPPDAL